MRHVAPVTIVIPAHAAAATLGRTLESVASAKPKAAEVIVVVDGSDPATEAVLLQWPELKVLRFAENGGACAARNLGLNQATTRYVLFLDADDCISPGLLGHLSWTAENDGADITFANHAIEHKDGSLTMMEANRQQDARELMSFWLSGKYVPPCAVLWNADFLRHLGGWDEALAQNQDGDVIHRALYGGARVSWSRAGYGIYVQRDVSTRVSKNMTPEAVASQFQVLERVERMNATSGLVPERHIGQAWYLLARRLYGRGEDFQAGQALDRARALGFKGHAGGLPHRIAAQLFGLELKSKLARGLRQLFKKAPSFQTLGLSNKVKY